MANNTIIFENPRTGQVRSAPVGLSWTTLLFGPFPMLFRGSCKWFVIILLLALITGGLSNIIFLFAANKAYIKELISEGFQVKSVARGTLSEMGKQLGYALPLHESTARPRSRIAADQMASDGR